MSHPGFEFQRTITDVDTQTENKLGLLFRIICWKFKKVVDLFSPYEK